MLITDWMKENVITVSPKTSLLQCRALFKELNINRLPVVDEKKNVLGLLSSSDIRAFVPQRSTGLEILEALDVMSETPASDVMVKNPHTIHYNSTVEQAAQMMFDKHVACLPVVDDQEVLIGIITGWDVFRALLSISGAEQPGEEAGFLLPNKPGTVRELLEILKINGLPIISVLSTDAQGGMRQVKIRFKDPGGAAVDTAIEQFKAHPGLRYWLRSGKVFLKEGEPFKE